ncbi:MAG: N,N-dimethylformamidase beta subunit family domain-containing protein [Burkholderiales bacterium]
MPYRIHALFLAGLVACSASDKFDQITLSKTTTAQESSEATKIMTKPPLPNVIQRENAKSIGVTREWQISTESDYAANHEIEGYASATSVARGGTINFYVHTVSKSYTLDVYRVGWYGGVGGRLIHSGISTEGTKNLPGIQQPSCPTVDKATSLLECNWKVSHTLNVPDNPSDQTDWASGYYLVKLTSSDGKQSYIPFVVRDDNRNADLMMQAAVTTYQAYNNWGYDAGSPFDPNPGWSLYDYNSKGNERAFKVSFNRPYSNILSSHGAGQFFAFEIYMLRFLEKEGYDVVYSTNIDTHNSSHQLRRYKAFLSVGHDEYWTKQMRDAIQAARDLGVNLGFFGANMGYWQIRLEPSIVDGTPDRTIVSYKNASFFKAIIKWLYNVARGNAGSYQKFGFDPQAFHKKAETTVRFRESPVNRPEAELQGIMFDYDQVNGDIVISDYASWICNGTNLRNGDKLKGMLGYEVDRVDGSSPANVQIIGTSPYPILKNGSPSSEIRYSHMTYYEAQSGAGVFSSGSMYWNFGLDDFGARNSTLANTNVQQITRNVLNAFIARSQQKN